ncbi:MAG TPA: hypothetical protein PKL29_04135 [Methanothrix sp.]|nr:hypothetical protein [Methanothrix sp.]
MLKSGVSETVTTSANESVGILESATDCSPGRRMFFAALMSQSIDNLQ